MANACNKNIQWMGTDESGESLYGVKISKNGYLSLETDYPWTTKKANQPTLARVIDIPMKNIETKDNKEEHKQKFLSYLCS